MSTQKLMTQNIYLFINYLQKEIKGTKNGLI